MGLHQSIYATGMFAGPWITGMIAARFGFPVTFSATGIAALVLGLLGTGMLARARRQVE